MSRFRRVRGAQRGLACPLGPQAAVMRLQRAAGNRAAVQLVARSRSQLRERVLARDLLDDMEKDEAARAGRFDDPKVQAVYDKHGPGTERQRLALGILDFASGRVAGRQVEARGVE